MWYFMAVCRKCLIQGEDFLNVYEDLDFVKLAAVRIHNSLDILNNGVIFPPSSYVVVVVVVGECVQVVLIQDYVLCEEDASKM